MKNQKISLILLMVVFLSAFAADISKQPTVSVTRTELKVSRSLNPENTQTLNVMTKQGSVATLIVKRRDSKSDKSKNSQSSVLSTPKKSIENGTITTSSTTFKPSEQTKNAEVYFLNVNEKPKNTYEQQWSPLYTIDPSFFSVDQSKAHNLEIKNHLKGNEQKNVYITSTTFMDPNRILRQLPAPVDVRSGDIFVKNQQENKRGRAIISSEINLDNVPEIEGVRMPDSEEDKYKTWRNARVINGELIPYENGYKPEKAVAIGELIFANSKAIENSETKGIGPFTKQDNYARSTSNIGPFTVKDNLGVTHSEGVEENFNRNRNDYVRFNANTGFGPFTKADNSRIANSKLIDYIKEINAQEYKRDYFSRRNVRSQDGNMKFPSDTQQIQRRMLHYQGNTNYPTSKLYATQSNTKLSPVHFVDGVRTPVLQYAHPELGVQPVRVPTEAELQTKKDPIKKSSGYYDYQNDGRQTKYYETPNHNDFGYYRKDVMNYPYGSGYYTIKQTSEQPFWYKITESIKDNFQNGIEKMHQLTRPVFDPIVEATQKIGHNLGFSNGPPQMAQDKIGAGPVMTSSVILPALGLVAGGAALGLGAAAVGRFLDVGMMRGYPSEGELIDDAELQHKRALEAFSSQYSGAQQSQQADNTENIYVIMDPSTLNSESKPIHRQKKRSIDTNDEVFVLQKLADELDGDKNNLELQYLAQATHWSNTPCAKRLFCDVMLRKGADQIYIMEKKMDSFLSIVHPVVAASVPIHLHDVMDAIKSHDCSRFQCNERPI